MRSYRMRYEVDYEIAEEDLDNASALVRTRLKAIRHGLKSIRAIVSEYEQLKKHPVIEFLEQMEEQLQSVERNVRVDIKRRERSALHGTNR